MYYLINPKCQLVGYKRLPYAIHDLSRSKTEFLNVDQFAVFAFCDGKHDLDKEKMSDADREYLKSIVEKEFVLPLEKPGELKSYQKYVFYDNIFKDMVHWSVTGRCNYRCKHCFMSAPDAKYGHPTKEQCLNLISQMEECGIKNVSITGGEPLIRDDFMELVEAFTNHHIRIKSILTNGKLVNNELLDGLEKFYQHPSFQMSYDGNGWHDWMRGIDGAEEIVLNAFRLLRDRGYSTSSSMALHKKSIGSIRESVKTLAEVGCGSVKISPASPSGEWKNHPEYFLTMAETYKAFLDYIPQYFEDDAPLALMLSFYFNYETGADYWTIGADMKSTGEYDLIPICAQLRSSIYVAPEGNVQPCQSIINAPISSKYPNVYTTPLKEILTESTYTKDCLSHVSDFMAKNPDCVKCPHAKRCCGGCRAVAIGDDGTDFFAPDKNVCEFFVDGWDKKFTEVADREFAKFKANGGVERGKEKLKKLQNYTDDLNEC